MAHRNSRRPQHKRKPTIVPRPSHLEKGTGRELMAKRPAKKRFLAAAAAPTNQPKTPRIEWTKEQDQIIRQNYTRHGSVHTAKLLGRSKQSVQHRALRLGVPGHGIKPWTKKEVAYLRLQYPKRQVAEICRVLNRTEQSVRGKIHLLGLGGEPSRPWTTDEVSYLKKHYHKVPVADLVEEFGRSRDAIELKAGKLGLSRKNTRISAAGERYIVAQLGKEAFTTMAARLGVSVHNVMAVARRNGYRDRPTSRPWTDADDALLTKYYGTMAHSDVADRIDRTELAVVLRARSLGLKSTFRKKRTNIVYNPWTPTEDATLKRLYPTRTAKQIAEKIGRTESSVNSRVSKLGLRKT